MEDSAYFQLVAQCYRQLNEYPDGYKNLSTVEAFQYLRGRCGLSDDLLEKIIDEIYAKERARERHKANAPEWFKPLLGMGVTAGQWEDARDIMYTTMTGVVRTPENPADVDHFLGLKDGQEKFNAWCYLCDLSDELAEWVISDPM